MKFGMRVLRKTVENIQVWLKSDRNMKTKVSFDIVGDIKWPLKRCLRVELYQAVRRAAEV